MKIILPTLLLVCAVLFCIAQYTKKSFNDVLGTNEANITKVFMCNGSNGYTVETNDKDKIKELINSLNNRYYRKALIQLPRSGYSYFYDFYSGDKEIIRITGHGKNVNINGTYYSVSKAISIDSLTNWFNSLPVNTYE